MKFKFKIIFILFIFLLNPLVINALEYPNIDSKVIEIYDLTDNKLIYEIDSNKEIPIASLTKIVTTITAIENIDNLNKKVIITKEMLDTVKPNASVAGLKINDKLSYMDLLYASMLPSGADATNSLAILSSGSINNFVSKMNDLANKLNLKHTHFVNVTGLDEEGHYSSADDIRKILSYALNNELFRKIYTTRTYKLSNNLDVYSTIITYNKNSTIDTSKIIGSKTGYTKKAGYCLSSLSNINSHEFIIIVLGAEHKNNIYYNILDTVSVINFLLDNYKDQILVKKDELIKTIPIELSKVDTYDIKVIDDVKLYLPSDYDKNKIKIEYDGLNKLSFRNNKGDSIGTISYYYDDKLIKKDFIVLDFKLELSIKKLLKKYFYIFVIIPIIITIIILKLKKKRK